MNQHDLPDLDALTAGSPGRPPRPRRPAALRQGRGRGQDRREDCPRAPRQGRTHPANGKRTLPASASGKPATFTRAVANVACFTGVRLRSLRRLHLSLHRPDGTPSPPPYRNDPALAGRR